MDNKILIEIVTGGFILSYPSDKIGNGYERHVKEVFTSARKMHQKIKSVLDDLALVADE